jgi:multiple sugar transport system substrate-binding protein
MTARTVPALRPPQPTRRSFLTWAGIAPAVSILTGCRAGAPERQAPDERGPVEIRLSVWGDVPDKDIYWNMADDFHAQQQKARVAPEQYLGQSYYEKLQTLLAGGQAPDVMYFQGWIWQPYVLQGVLLALDSYLSRDKSMQRVVPPGYEAQSKFRGKPYMLTADTGPMVIFYNKELFDRAGVPYPKEGWTLDDLVETARRLTFKEGDTQYWGYQVNGGYLRNFPWMRLNGAREWDRIEEPKKAFWDSAGIVKELQLQLVDLINRYRYAPPRTAQTEQNHIQFGYAAMKMEGPWFLPQMWGPKARREGGINFDVAPMPRGTEQHAVHLQHGHVVNAATRYADAAWTFLQHVASDQGQQRVAEFGRCCNLPETTERIWGPVASRTFNFKNVAAFLHAQRIGSINVTGGVSEAEILRDAELGPALNDMMDGKIGAKDALTAVQPKIQRLLDEYWARQGGR